MQLVSRVEEKPNEGKAGVCKDDLYLSEKTIIPLGRGLRRYCGERQEWDITAIRGGGVTGEAPMRLWGYVEDEDLKVKVGGRV